MGKWEGVKLIFILLEKILRFRKTFLVLGKIFLFTFFIFCLYNVEKKKKLEKNDRKHSNANKWTAA